MNVQFSKNLGQLLTETERRALERAVLDTVTLERRKGERTRDRLRLSISAVENMIRGFIRDAGNRVAPIRSEHVYAWRTPLYVVSWAVATDLHTRGVRIEDYALVQR